MDEDDKRLAEQCLRLARGTQEASAWLADNRALTGPDLEDHEKQLRKAGRLFRQCALAAGRKMCVGVFGPSQAGKSYLVSSLAGNEEGRLWTQMEDATRDFLSEINPAGGKESTGLVTRFTLTPQTEAPDGHPVRVRLLSVIDVVKIFANTYFSDAEHMQAPDRQAMLERLKALEARKRSAPTGGVSSDDVEDLQEYIHKYFRGKARVQQLLDRHFWDRVIPLAPLLHDADRAELFAMLWDGVAPFTSSLRVLAEALRALDFAPEAFCPASALVPRETSIIDVASLRDLSPQPDDTLSLVTSGGKSAVLPRVYVAALTAELVIPMRDKPAELFTHTDLLDFPGYRSRKMFVDLAKESEDPAKLRECFLRGKVAYLFERYCAERELTALLLCIGSGVQEVQGLGGALNDWIAGTHGSTAELRGGKDTALFFILTKSDLEFEDKAGAKNVSERWDTRMYASMEIFSSHEWLGNWSERGAFDNFFLMRNPTVMLHLFEHDEKGRELALKQESVAYLRPFEEAFMQSPLVNRHFAHKKESWEAFLTPGDGGLSLIRAMLAPVCKPELKRAQIAGAVRESLARIVGRLKPYLRTDDKEGERREKAVLAQNLARIVLAMVSTRRFGRLLRLLTLRDQDVADLYFRAQYQIQAELTESPAPAQSADDLLITLLGEDALLTGETAKAPSAAPPSAAPSVRDEAQAFAEHIETFWLELMRGHADDPVLQHFFSFPGPLFSRFVHELGVGFARLGLRATLADALRKAGRFANLEKDRLVSQQASLATAIINSYTTWLGFTPQERSEEERRITLGNKQRVLFSPVPHTNGLPRLEEDPGQYTDSLIMDWAAALIHLVNENANFDGVRDFDPVQNSRLREIIQGFAIKNI